MANKLQLIHKANKYYNNTKIVQGPALWAIIQWHSIVLYTNTKLICKDPTQISDQNPSLPSCPSKKSSTQTTLRPNSDQISFFQETQILSFITLGFVCIDCGSAKKQRPCGRKSKQSRLLGTRNGQSAADWAIRTSMSRGEQHCQEGVQRHLYAFENRPTPALFHKFVVIPTMPIWSEQP